MTIIECLKRSLIGERWLLLSTIIISVLHGFSSVLGFTAFVPVISIIAGRELAELSGIPYIGNFILSISDDRAVVFYLMIFVIVGLSLFKASLQVLSAVIDSIIKKHVETKWQDQIMRRWLNAPFSCHTTDHVGKLIHVVSREVIQISHSARAFVQICSAIIQSFVALLFLTFVAPFALLLVASSIVVVVLPLTVLTRRMHSIASVNAFETGNYINRTHDVIKRIDLIDVYGTADLELDSLNSFHESYLKSQLRLAMTNALSPFVIQICLSSLLAALLVYFFEMGAGQDILALVVLFIGGLSMINPQIERISQGVMMLTRSSAAYSEIKKIVNLPSRKPEPQSGAVNSFDKARGVELRDVSFSYESGGKRRHILKDVSLSLDFGKLYMLFGATGTGKTTFLRLLQRMQEPISGEVSFGGIPLADLSQRQMAESILMMQQDRLVFSGSIRENIEYGIGSQDDDALVDVLHLSETNEFLRHLSGGVEAHTGLDGAHLSGGQRQRVALARIFAAKPTVMLLDEPTSALDRDTEHRVINNLLEMKRRGHTIVMSTHKVELAPFADSVLWFENGNIREGDFLSFQDSLRNLIPDEKMESVILSGMKSSDISKRDI
ncbi:MAG: ABC transporter ATP-binding protein [Thalassospira sp.]|uniref:ABC transporter ATP-binding protein n=1 Tax=Thalassospira sp. TaxID=1912094 RepID=UPI0032EED85F